MQLKRNSSNSPIYTRSILRVVLFTIGLIASANLLYQPATRNWAFHDAFEAVLRQPADFRLALNKLELIVPQDCRVNWQIGLLTLRVDNPMNIDSNLNNMLDCTSASISWLLIIAPERLDIAYRAAQRYPQEARVWFWLGDLSKTSGDLPQADKYFSESVRIDPTYALAWCRLGTVKEQQGLLQDAENVFWECCQNGDPGSNGCYGAGRVAEKLEDVPGAIRYYRRSHWFKALQRADELEASR